LFGFQCFARGQRSGVFKVVLVFGGLRFVGFVGRFIRFVFGFVRFVFGFVGFVFGFVGFVFGFVFFVQGFVFFVFGFLTFFFAAFEFRFFVFFFPFFVFFFGRRVVVFGRRVVVESGGVFGFRRFVVRLFGFVLGFFGFGFFFLVYVAALFFVRFLGFDDRFLGRQFGFDRRRRARLKVDARGRSRRGRVRERDRVGLFGFAVDDAEFEVFAERLEGLFEAAGRERFFLFVDVDRAGRVRRRQRRFAFGVRDLHRPVAFRGQFFLVFRPRARPDAELGVGKGDVDGRGFALFDDRARFGLCFESGVVGRAVA